MGDKKTVLLPVDYDLVVAIHASLICAYKWSIAGGSPAIPERCSELLLAWLDQVQELLNDDESEIPPE